MEPVGNRTVRKAAGREHQVLPNMACSFDQVICKQWENTIFYLLRTPPWTFRKCWSNARRTHLRRDTIRLLRETVFVDL